jgi:glycosyltransferase involved in cell wall biosynthesis
VSAEPANSARWPAAVADAECHLVDGADRRGDAPRVTIGLPIYNGERYLREAIESVLAQTFHNLELVICDNASTDSTDAICREYAARDDRIRYVRNESNLGASRNFNLTFELARSEFFRWLAADDALGPRCIERCVAALDADPGAVIAHTDVSLIGEVGESLGRFDYPAGHAQSPNPAKRFRDVLAFDRWCFEVFGLVRTDAMRLTRLLDRYVASDRIFRAELALIGRYAHVPEPLFLNRDHSGRSVRALPAHHLRAAWFDPSKARKRILPHWRILFEYARSIHRARIGFVQKVACYCSLPRWLGRHMNWARLLVDLVLAVAPNAWRVFAKPTSSGERWLNAGSVKS